MHHILFYDFVEGIVERRAPYREAHLALVRAQQDAGSIVLAGAVGDPPQGAAIVFVDTPAEDIESFAREDPYVQAGLVTDWRVEPWKVV